MWFFGAVERADQAGDLIKEDHNKHDRSKRRDEVILIQS